MRTFLHVLPCCVILTFMSVMIRPALSQPGFLPSGEAELNGFPLPGLAYIAATANNLYADGQVIFKPSDVVLSDRIVSVHRRLGTPDEIIITLFKGFACTYRVTKSGQHFTLTQLRLSPVAIFNFASAKQTVGATQTRKLLLIK